MPYPGEYPEKILHGFPSPDKTAQGVMLLLAVCFIFFLIASVVLAKERKVDHFVKNSSLNGVSVTDIPQ